MATRGSALQRALKYFREADVDEMRVAFTLAEEIVERRLTATQQDKPEKPKQTRTRKPKSSSLLGTGQPAQNAANIETRPRPQDETLADA